MREGHRVRKVLLLGACLILAGLVWLPTANAAIARSGDTVTVPRGQTVTEDMYVSANTISIDGTLTSDLAAVAQRIVVTGVIQGNAMLAAQTIVIDGRVGTDLNCAAQTIVINGDVGDDARMAAQSIQLGSNSQVSSDLLAASQSFDLPSGSLVGRDVWTAANQGVLDGDVGRDLLGTYQSLRIGGRIGRNATVQIGEDQSSQNVPGTSLQVSPGLTVASGADIRGKLTYTSRRKANIESGARIGGGVEQKAPRVRPEERREETAVTFVLNQIRRLVTLVLVGLLLIWLFPGWISALATGIEEKPLPALGWGFLAFIAFIASVIGVFFAMILLAVLFGIATLGGIVKLVVSLGLLSEALLVGGYLIFVWSVAHIVVSLLVGRLVLSRTAYGAQHLVWTLLLGILIYWIVTAVPVLGVLVSIAAALFALGSLWMWTTGMMRTRREEAPPPVPAE